MKLLITGISGFLGSTLLSELTKDPNLDICISSSNLENIKRPQDILRLGSSFRISGEVIENLNQLQTLILLGSATPKNQLQTMNIRDNLESIIFNWILLSQKMNSLKKIIYVSSMDVYLRNSHLINESSPIGFTNAYVANKLFCEEMILKYAHDHSIAIDIFRVGHVYGPNSDKYEKVLNRVIRSIKEEMVFEVKGNLLQEVNLTYVSDVCEVIKQSMLSDTGYGVTNITASRNRNLDQVIKLCERLLKKNLQLQLVESNVNFQYQFDNSKLKSEFKFNEIEFEEGVLRTIYG